MNKVKFRIFLWRFMLPSNHTDLGGRRRRRLVLILLFWRQLWRHCDACWCSGAVLCDWECCVKRLLATCKDVTNSCSWWRKIKIAWQKKTCKKHILKGTPDLLGRGVRSVTSTCSTTTSTTNTENNKFILRNMIVTVNKWEHYNQVLPPRGTQFMLQNNIR